MSEFPIGRWNVQVKDAVGSRLELEIDEYGQFVGTQFFGQEQVALRGTWRYSTDGSCLELVGKVNELVDFSIKLLRRLGNVFVMQHGSYEFLFVFERAEQAA